VYGRSDFSVTGCRGDVETDFVCALLSDIHHLPSIRGMPNNSALHLRSPAHLSSELEQQFFRYVQLSSEIDCAINPSGSPWQRFLLSDEPNPAWALPAGMVVARCNGVALVPSIRFWEEHLLGTRQSPPRLAERSFWPHQADYGSAPMALSSMERTIVASHSCHCPEAQHSTLRCYRLCGRRATLNQPHRASLCKLHVRINGI
jgi:hypothetical protein